MKKLLIACCLTLSLFISSLVSFAEESNAHKCEVRFKALYEGRNAINLTYIEVRKNNADGEIIWSRGEPDNKNTLYINFSDNVVYLIPGIYRIWIEEFRGVKTPWFDATRKIVGWKTITITQEDVNETYKKGITKFITVELNRL